MSQQISSFNRFVNISLQDIIQENGELQIEVQPQYLVSKYYGKLTILLDKPSQDTDKLIVWEIKFGQASVNQSPRITEEDDKYGAIYPHEARMRNLTYATELFVDITLSKKELDRHEYELDQKTGLRKRKVKQVLAEYASARVMIGKIPVMLRSQFC